jgi:Rps23 Pro-64 3,4-dihydroxylase Tpa1-like proline 4-hydroxylase
MLLPIQFDYPALYHFADQKAMAYKSGGPFPHIVIDNFLSSSTYQLISRSFPKKNHAIWKTPTNKHTVGKSVTKNGELGLKEFLYSENARRFFFELNSGLFLTFIEKLTGISGLIPDPYFSEGGFHRTAAGGYLGIHADFSHSDKLGLERRVNIIFYLNDDWKEFYGGGLGLYNKKLKKIVDIAPLENRAVIFTTSDHSFHGHPEPLLCPKNIYRKSIALYYYTVPTINRKKSRILFPSDPEFTQIPTKY